MKRLFAVASALVLLASSAFVQAQNAPQPPAAPAPGITGTMEINYVTRQPQGMDDNGKPKKGVQDQYKLDLTVNGNNQFQGTILRQPRIRNAVYMTTQQPRYDYSINLFVSLKDGTKPNVGSWVGPMQVDEKSGAFILDAEGDRALRMNITAGSGFTDAYGGRFFGKAADKSKLSWDTITRTVNGKTIEKKFEADPMRFEGVRLAKGPNPKQYQNCTVTGELSYDRETANYYAKGLRFVYQTPDNKQVEDVVTGTIKWVEDPNRKSNGKGYYEFNLRYNEDKSKPAQTDDQAFGGKGDDDLFFAVDKSIPALTGHVEYVDQMSGGDTVTSSKVTYKLVGSNLTNQQVMNFAKLWLIAVGPTNDE
jgi:hypothetical protein